VTRHSVQEYAASVRRRYRAGNREVKRRVLDEFCQATGMHRKAAIRLLNQSDGVRPVIGSGGRPRIDDPEVVAALALVWEASDRMCGKLLAVVMADLVDALERHGELQLTPEAKQRLIEMSPATIDRRLQRYKRVGLRQPQRKQPRATGLKAEVPLKTWSEWQDAPVGSVQADLVLHCGESTEGFYLATLCVIDIATGWTELQPVWGTTQEETIASLHMVWRRLPFKLLALHTDNGSEFINHKLLAWCRREGVKLTRGRGYRKNDQAYVEQKNWQLVRRLVGYDRLSSKEAQTALLQLYACLRQLNFFRPVRKLISKQRSGAKTAKQYDEPRTPYQRLLASGVLTEQAKAPLEQAYLAVNPAALTRRIDELQRRLWRLGQQERTLVANVG
jgi:transposase InsO family protein